MTKILLIGSYDWLFAQRHLPAVRAARELDLDVLVVTRVRLHRRLIEAAGARVLDSGIEATGWKSAAMWRLALRLKELILAEKPTIVQFFGMRLAVAGALAVRLAGGCPCVFSFTGLGSMSRQDNIRGKASLMVARNLMLPVAGAGNQLVFDNPDDAALLGLDGYGEAEAGRAQVRILPGSGVDPLIHSPEPMPWLPPLKLVFGSPLLWANGPDLAVEAVTRARGAGADVTLSLIGRACEPGAAAVPEAVLSSWSQMPGVSWFAPTADIAQIWRQHHVLVLPSRGGDGLSLLLTEAAAAERCIITTDVGGCRSFVRDGIDGLVVPQGDSAALSQAIIQLARAPGLVERMGRSARERVLDGYTERHVTDAMKQIWRQMLQREVIV